MTTKLGISIGQHSDRGIKPDNEDFYGFSEPREPQLSRKGIVVAISDGMSGSEGGKQASRACIIGFLSDYFSTPDSWTVEHSTRKILSATNSWLYSNGHSQYESASGLVATLSILVFKSNTAHLFHIGDSRVYRMRDGGFEQMTRDHRVTTPEGKSYLNRAMGIEPHLNVDCRRFQIQVGDVFLLTTDGVHEFVPRVELKKTLQEYHDDLQAGAEAIVRSASENQSDDNLTCQIVRIESLPLASDQELARKNANIPFPPPLEPGMILDGYRVEKELHASKRTQIYIATDTLNDEPVILKTPSVNFEDDPVYIEHFLHEEWAGKRLNHQNVLKVVNTNREKKWIYYVTEYIDGCTLREWIESNPRADVRKAIAIVEQIAKGLRAFHRMEMLHQDLKPENIMIDKSGTVKIIDFGSVRIAGIVETQPQLEKDSLLGTRNYSAPEQQIGQRGDVRSDLFSLAVITYEILTGALPFGQEMPEDPTPTELSRLEYVSGIHRNPMIPVWIDGAIRKAASINPERRYEALSEFVHDLNTPNKQFLNDQVMPLIQKNPLLFWQSVCAILAVSNIVLLYLLNQVG